MDTNDPNYLPGNYQLRATPPPAGTYDIGLVMAGAISAGAYTAGVIDFLVEALDAWEAEKAEQRQKYGADSSKWDIPGHNVRLRILAGASAGAITAAIGAAALRYDFPHIRKDSPAPERNPLYRAWVKAIDITKLLGLRDLASDEASVVSLLDSTVLDDIASDAISYAGPGAPPRPWLASPTRFVFTHGNLRGIPYFMPIGGNLAKGGLAMLAHGDHAGFSVEYQNVPPRAARDDDTPLAFPNSYKQKDWNGFATAALASGAFPIGLSPRAFERNGTCFNYRFVITPGEVGKPPKVVQLKPDWDPTPDSYRTLVVDGGTMNNEPLDLVRVELSGLAESNPRDGNLANRGVVMIDPFPDQAGVTDDPKRGQQADLIKAGLALTDAWKDQARFKPEDLALASDETIYSRFLVAPSRGSSPESAGFAIACGALGGFSGFLHEEFRRHDYFLGRRNAQRFLHRHFCLPVENQIVFGVVNPALKDKDGKFAFDDNGRLCLPIIPLMDSLVNKEEELYAWPAGKYQPDSLRDPLDKRLSRVLENMLRNSVKLNWFFRQFAEWGLRKVRKTLVDKVVERINGELSVRKLV